MRSKKFYDPLNPDFINCDKLKSKHMFQKQLQPETPATR